MTLLILLLGGVAGTGLVLLYVALSGQELPRIRRSPIRSDSRIGRTQMENLGVRLGLGAVGGLLSFLVTGWPVLGLIVAALGFMAPSLLGSGHARKARIARVEAVAAWAEMLRDTMAGAGGLEQSIIASAGIAPAPIRAEVVRLAARLERERLAPALREFADELDDPVGDLVVAALLLAADRNPRKLGELLGTLAEAAREEVTVRMRIDAGRARSRTSVKVISAVTGLVAGGMVLFNRTYMEPYDTVTGQMVLVLVAVMFAGSFFWLAKGAEFQAQDRFLPTGSAATDPPPGRTTDEVSR